MNKLKIKVKSIFRCLRLEDLPTKGDIFYMDKKDLLWLNKILIKEKGRLENEKLDTLLKQCEEILHFHECTDGIDIKIIKEKK